MSRVYCGIVIVFFLFPVIINAGGARELMNVWHIPSNEEPPTVTMRNPLHPSEGDENCYFYCGGYPQHTIWSGELFYRITGGEEWETLSLNWDSNPNNNEYFIGVMDISGLTEGQTVEYYFKIQGDPGNYVDTYLYGDDNHSFSTSDENEAQMQPYIFTLSSPHPTPTSTSTPGPGLLNVWHIPVNTEPSGTTMRSPVYPQDSDSTVTLLCGAYPAGNTASSGELFYKVEPSGSWNEVTLTFFVQEENNDYWEAVLDISQLPVGTTLSYYFEMRGNSEEYLNTFVWGTDDSTHTTSEREEAESNPFRFTIGNRPTPSPSPSGTPEPMLNVWHIPINEEPSGTTMRKPLYPTTSTDSVQIFCGGFPQDSIWSGALFWRSRGSTSWSSSSFEWNSNSDVNVYWVAELNNSTFPADTVIEYYLLMSGNPETTPQTYVYGSDTESFTTANPDIAQANPFTYTVGHGITTPTPTPPFRTPTPTRSPTPTPSATVTPTPNMSLGVKFELPQETFSKGDVFYCDAYVSNPGETLYDIKLFIALDIYEQVFWFWPGWKQYPPYIDYETIILDKGTRKFVVVPECSWPDVPPSDIGARFIGALVDNSLTTIIGDMDIFEFKWH